MNKEDLDPRRCADIGHFSIWGSDVSCKCGHFWWDCGPKDEYNDDYSPRTVLMCMKDDKPLTMGMINHTARHGCCCWKPEFEDRL